jgi:CDP-diacylglycerol--glycerol-3-phosphate 3-phosphatidyltransferase
MKKHHGLLVLVPLLWYYFMSYLAHDPSPRDPLGIALKETGEVPNGLTQIRLILSPFPLLFIALGPGDVTMLWLAAITFGVVMATDALDGHWARAWKHVSDHGKVWDPVADKAITFLTLLGLCIFSLVPAPPGTETWFAWTYVIYTGIREVGLLAIRGRFVIPANWVGKWKTILLSTAFGMMLAPFTIMFPIITPWWNGVVIALLIGSFVCSFVSGIQYLIIYLKMSREAKEAAQ